MNDFLMFITENYIPITIITIILILALIGYLVDANIGKDVKIKSKEINNATNIETSDIEGEQKD